MCIIEGLGALDDTHAGDPLEDHKLNVSYSSVSILLEDRGSPTGRFLNDIAAWTMRGIGEWMTKNDHFKQMSVGVYYNQYYCGVAEVGLVSSSGLAAESPSDNPAS